jgi:hypothetical protein
MTLTAYQEARVLEMVAADLVAELRPKADALELLTMKQGAERLNVSVLTFRRLVREYVDLGEHCQRVSVSQLQDLIQQRTIRRRS